MKSLATIVLVLTVLHSSMAALGIGNYAANVDPAENPSIFKPQEYTLQEESLFPDIPKIPGGLEIPKIPKLPEIPKIPGVPEIPKIPGAPEIPKIPGVPEIPKIPGAPEIPKAPETPKVPEIPKIPGLPDIPSLPDIIPQRVCLVVRCFPRWSKFQVCRCVKSRV